MGMQPKKSAIAGLASKFLSLDNFGIPINLNYQGSSVYKTNIGSLFTIIMWVMVATYLGVQFDVVFQRNEIKMSRYQKFLGSGQDFVDRSVNLTLNDFLMNFTILYNGPNKTLSSDKKQIYTLFSPVAGNEVNSIKIPIKIVNCMKISEATNDHSLCLNTPQVTLGPNRGSTALIKFEVFFCRQTVLDEIFPGESLVCKSPEESQANLPFVQLILGIQTNYFDVGETWQNSIKKINKGYGLGFSTTLAQANIYYLKENKNTIRNSILSKDIDIMDAITYDIVQHSTYFNDLAYKLRMYSFQLYLDDEVVYTERSILTLIDAITDVGGFLGAVTVLFCFISSFFGKMMFDNDLANMNFFEAKSQNQLKKLSSYLIDINKDGKILSIMNIIVIKMTSCCPCFRSSHVKQRYQLLLRAKKKLSKEVSIQKIIEHQRSFEIANKLLLPSLISQNLKFFMKRCIINANPKSITSHQTLKQIGTQIQSKNGKKYQKFLALFLNDASIKKNETVDQKIVKENSSSTERQELFQRSQERVKLTQDKTQRKLLRKKEQVDNVEKKKEIYPLSRRNYS